VLAIEGNHLFQLGSWTSVLIGQRFLPKGVHALADRADPQFAARQIREIAQEVAAAASRQPMHDQFLAEHCPAPPEIGRR
jgi:tryptophan halogenase